MYLVKDKNIINEFKTKYSEKTNYILYEGLNDKGKIFFDIFYSLQPTTAPGIFHLFVNIMKASGDSILTAQGWEIIYNFSEEEIEDLIESCKDILGLSCEYSSKRIVLEKEKQNYLEKYNKTGDKDYFYEASNMIAAKNIVGLNPKNLKLSLHYNYQDKNFDLSELDPGLIICNLSSEVKIDLNKFANGLVWLSQKCTRCF